MIIFTVILMDLLTGMEFDLFVPSFPELNDYFHLSPFLVELSLSVNFIGYCISLFVVGNLADRYGRKPIILLGLLAFILGSILCLSTTYYYFFLCGRFLQGLGIAAPSILSFLIIADLYSVKKQQFLMAMLNGSLNTAAAFAPVIGSYITKYFHWEGNFVTLFLLGLITFLMTLIFIPNHKIFLQKTTSSVHGYIAIFKSNTLILLMTYFMLMFVPYWIFVGMSPLLYMKDLGVSLTHFGYYQGSLALTFALGCLLFGIIINRYDQKKMLYVANQIFILSFLSIIFVTFKSSSNPLLITLAFIPFVIGQIIPSNIIYPLYLNLMPEAKGRLTAIIQGGRLIFASLGLQIAGYFYQGSFHNIGIIVGGFVLMGIIVMFFVLKQWSVIKSV
jgi:DHA1 family bicyclomycin/chloramphenicol resistance-like MFS transporter